MKDKTFARGVSREDVIIVASVSCIYGLGSPADYKRMMVYVPKGEVIDRENRYRDVLALADLSFEIEEGEICALCQALISSEGRMRS